VKPIAGWTDGPVTVALEQAELVAINNALNEALVAFEGDGEFHSRLGMSREEAERLLREVAALIAP
jgi:hypothetical protein